MPKPTRPRKTNTDPPSRQKRKGLSWGVCVLCATGLVLGVLQSYQKDLSGGMDRIKRRMEVKKEDYSNFWNAITMEDNNYNDNANTGGGGGKIAILSNFVNKDAEIVSDARFGLQLLNKACYADTWGYDFIYNVSWGFPNKVRSRNSSNNDNNPHLCYLDWGHWHRVPQMMALAENKQYEWILWADLDYVFWNLTQPLESLLQEIEMNNLHNVQVVVPDDGMAWYNVVPDGGADSQVKRGQFLFSSFAVLIRNSHFGRTVLQNWMDFAKGICPNGNFEDTNNCTLYTWWLADQPGLWYALGKTYSDLVEGSGEFAASCNSQTGYLDFHGEIRGLELGCQMSKYFTREGLIKSSDYSQIPRDQPILFSSFEKNKLSGIGINHLFVKGTAVDYKGVFGIHTKNRKNLGELQQSQLQHCRRPVAEGGRGCRIGTNEKGVFDLSCGNTSYVAWDSDQIRSNQLRGKLAAEAKAEEAKARAEGKSCNKEAYVGCYQDQLDRALPHKQDEHLSVAECRIQCRKLGHMYAGLQSGRECYCGSTYDKYGPTDENECNMICSDDRCGGKWRSSVYKSAQG